MTGFRVSAAALAVLAGLAGGAFAQTAPGAPVPLGPAVVPPRVAPVEPPRAAPLRSDLPITVDRLGAVDPDSVGLLGDGDGGLGVAMWRGSSRSLALELIATLPAPLSSPAMRGLARRLLITTATVPEGRPDKVSLLYARAGKLTELGAAQDSVDLIRAAPQNASDTALAQVEVEDLFFVNDNAGACARVRGIEPQASYWQQALVYCLALAGETERASMMADLMRDRGAETMPAFFALLDAVLGDKGVKIEFPADPSALALSMMRAANRNLPGTVAESKSAAVLRVVAQSPNADVVVRLAGAERAAALGALSPQELAQIEAGAPFTPDEVSNAVRLATAQWSPRTRVLLARAAIAASSSAARADVLSRAFALAREKGDLAALRRAVAPALDGFTPGPETISVAAEVGAALYALGRGKEGDAWYAAVEQAAPANPEAARAWVVLWPLAQLATKPVSWDPPMVARWRAAQGPAGEETAVRARTTLIFALFEALGQRVPGESWAALVHGAGAGETATMPDTAVFYALDSAARDKRRAEAAALSLVVVGARGPAAANPVALGAALGALSRAGLEADARALAVEAASGG